MIEREREREREREKEREREREKERERERERKREREREGVETRVVLATLSNLLGRSTIYPGACVSQQTKRCESALSILAPPSLGTLLPFINYYSITMYVRSSYHCMQPLRASALYILATPGVSLSRSLSRFLSVYLFRSWVCSRYTILTGNEAN